MNTFGWFIDRPKDLPPIPGLTFDAPPEQVEVEYCARFPWSGGRHPWLDALVRTPSLLIGVESKRFEPFRSQKTPRLSDAYDRPVWGDRMSGYQAIRDRLRTTPAAFRHLDAAQLVKHALGLLTDSARAERHPVLVYLFAEPSTLGGRQIPSSALALHRAEIEEFRICVANDAVAFQACSYREWLSIWAGHSPEVAAHAEAVLARFAP